MRNRTPPSGVSVRTESRRTGVNCGVVGFHQIAEKTSLFESVSISMKGGWKETRGVQRPISAEIPVSESRIAPLNPFETKRKKVPSGTLSRVCNVQLADGVGFEPTVRLHARRFSRPVQSTTLPPIRMSRSRSSYRFHQTFVNAVFAELKLLDILWEIMMSSTQRYQMAERSILKNNRKKLSEVASRKTLAEIP